jgi:Xaa-Pro aminopeptidase
MNYKKRIFRAKKEVEKRGIDACVITSWQSLYYLTGMRPIQSRSASPDPMPLLLSPDHEPVFIPTAAFGMAAKLEHGNVKEIRPYDGPEMWTRVVEVVKEWNKHEGNIGIESKYLVHSHAQMLREKIPEATFLDCSGIIEEMRMIKDDEELRRIGEAAKITDRVVEVVSKDHLKPGVTELEVAGEITRACIEFGAEDSSFHPQIFSGRRGYLLNISSSAKKLEKGEVVMLDFGASVDGYRTDTTRCFVLGRARTKQREAARVALKITENAVESVKPGVKASEIHKKSLKDFKKFGYDGYCRHYTGHGIGLNTWERPLLREFDDTQIRENMTIAVEQGLYFPDFGVRFEENLIVTKDGNSSLFGYPAELIELGV